MKQIPDAVYVLNMMKKLVILYQDAPNEYLNRHNGVAQQYFHWKICQGHGAPHAENWYKHHPEAVTKTENVTTLWDYSIQKGKRIKANKPDMVIKDKKEKTCRLIDAKVPAGKNV